MFQVFKTENFLLIITLCKPKVFVTCDSELIQWICSFTVINSPSFKYNQWDTCFLKTCTMWTAAALFLLFFSNDELPSALSLPWYVAQRSRIQTSARDLCIQHFLKVVLSSVWLGVFMTSFLVVVHSRAWLHRCCCCCCSTDQSPTSSNLIKDWRSFFSFLTFPIFALVVPY